MSDNMTDFAIEKGKPLVLPHCGTIIENAGEKKETVIRSKEEDEFERGLEDVVFNELNFTDTRLERSLLDMRCKDPKEMHPVMLILGYHIWGLPTGTIAMILNRPVKDIEDIMQEDLFKDTFDQIVESIRHAETGSINGYLSQQAHNAVKVVARTLRSKNTDAAFNAAKDILDRSGFRPADRVLHEHRHSMDDLRIIHIQRDRERLTLDAEIIGETDE